MKSIIFKHPVCICYWLNLSRMSFRVSSDDRYFHNDYPKDVTEGGSQILDADKKRVSAYVKNYTCAGISPSCLPFLAPSLPHHSQHVNDFLCISGGPLFLLLLIELPLPAPLNTVIGKSDDARLASNRVCCHMSKTQLKIQNIQFSLSIVTRHVYAVLWLLCSI